MNKYSSRLTVVGILFGLLLVGVVDYLTGLEIRIFPLYFVPLMLAAWFLGTGITALLSGLATVIWVVANFIGGKEYTQAYIWVINFFTQGSAFLLVPMLVTALRQALKRERDLARLDPLTGLLNRRAFYAESDSIVDLCHRKGWAISVAYIDLDNFKQANDRFGHKFGDQLLQAVAQILTGILRSSDLCCRIGGDEFIILLPETSTKVASAVLERIRITLIDEENLRQASVTVSIGAVSFDAESLDLDQMVIAADQVMYRVKSAAKNSVHVESYGGRTASGPSENHPIENPQFAVH